MYSPLLLVVSVILFKVVLSEAAADLLVAIPTVPRPRLLEREEPYLLQSLSAWRKVLDGDLNFTIRIVVVSHEEDDETFAEAKRLYGTTFEFISHKEVQERSTGENEECLASEDAGGLEIRRPVFKHVQKQALDLARTMRIVSKRFPFDKYFVLIEDDFVPCEDFLSRMRDILDIKAPNYGDWLSIRISYGFTGVVLRNGPDVLRVSDYIVRHRSRRPPDHLLVEFCAGETQEARDYKRTRPHLAFRYNLLEHIGKASTLRVRRDDSPKLDCLAPLGVPILFEVETCQDFGNQDLCAPTA